MMVKVSDEYSLVKDLVKEKENKKTALMPSSEGSKNQWNGNVIYMCYNTDDIVYLHNLILANYINKTNYIFSRFN